MTLNIEDNQTEKLAEEVAKMTGDTKAGAVRQALREKKERLEMRSGSTTTPPRTTLEFLETEIWPLIPKGQRGQLPMTKEEEEDFLGYTEEDR